MGEKFDADCTPGAKLLRIYRYLFVSAGRHFQSDLAEKFHCSAQTIIRIMAEIEFELGPLFETGLDNRRRWYRIRHKGETAGTKEFEEVRYLSICRDLARDMIPDAVLGRIEDTVQNLAQHLESCYPAGPSSPPPLYFLGKGRIDYDRHSGTISMLLDAIRGRQICLLSYRHGDGELERFRFAPACLLYLDETIFIAGAILNGDPELTNLAVHRIIVIEKLPDKFDVAFPDYSANTFGLPWHEPRTFRLLFEAGETAAYIMERKWSDLQKIRKRPDGSVELEITTRSETELRAWVRSFGSEARILSEPEGEIS